VDCGSVAMPGVCARCLIRVRLRTHTHRHRQRHTHQSATPPPIVHNSTSHISTDWFYLDQLIGHTSTNWSKLHQQIIHPPIGRISTYWSKNYPPRRPPCTRAQCFRFACLSPRGTNHPPHTLLKSKKCTRIVKSHRLMLPSLVV
jgi:hypothetical protein